MNLQFMYGPVSGGKHMKMIIAMFTSLVLNNELTF